MRNSRRMLLSVSTIALMVFAGLWSSLGFGQQAADSDQATPAVSGTGNAGRIAVWKNSTTLASSVVSQSSGNVGIGTTTPAAKLDVAGDINLAGNLRYQGNPVLQLPVGPGNLAVGLGTLPVNTTGTFNTASGQSALNANTTGSSNTAIGGFALATNNSGYANTANGTSALAANVSGADNTATGASALYNSNGNNNTAVGVSALYHDTIGSNNIAIGVAALSSNTTGSNNTALGYQAGINVITSNNIHIGSQGTAADIGTIRIGTPFVGGCTTCQTSAFIAGIYGSATGLPGVPVVVDSNGNLGTVSSSRRYKEDIQDMRDASDGLLRLRPVTFRYKEPFGDGSKPVQYGLIAEEVAEVYPDLVARSADGQIETVKYQLLDSMLLNELQKQNTTIAAQKEQIRSLEERLARVEAALERTALTASSR